MKIKNDVTRRKTLLKTLEYLTKTNLLNKIEI